MKKIEIGTVGVDSGSLMLVDPCYIKYIKNLHKDEEWKDYCENVLFPMHKGAVSASDEGNHVVFSTAHGDGSYPVIATLDKDNRIIKIEVKFT